MAVLLLPALQAQNIPVPNVMGPSGTQVNTLSGNLFYERTDICLLSPGADLNMSFAYNNQKSALNFGYGNGWTFAYNILYDPQGLDILIRRGDGRSDLFTWNGGGYDAPAGIFDVLTEYAPGQFSLTGKDGTVYYFNDNSHRRLTEVEDLNGNLLTITYSGGLPSTMVDAVGRSLSFTFSGGLLTRIDDPNASPARAVLYAYDANDNMIQATDPAGHSINYVYDANRNLIRIEDARGSLFDISYHAGGVSVFSISSALTDIGFSYSSSPMQTVVSEQVGASSELTTYEFDAQGRMIHQVGSCCGYNVQYQYDADNNIIMTTDANGNSSTSTFDTRGNRLSETDALANTESWTYDPVFNKVLSHTNKNGHTTNYSYDAAGNLLLIAKPLGVNESFSYFANGLKASHTDGNGNVSSFVYDANGNLATLNRPIGTESFIHDNIGNLLSHTDANGNNSSFTYDAVSQMLSATDAAANVTSYVYDGNGSVTAETDANGHTTLYSYDVLDRLIQVSDPLAALTTFSYDEKDNLLTTTDANGNVSVNSYDGRNLLKDAWDMLGNSKQFGYDVKGNLISAIDPNNNTSNFSYDAVDRLVSASNGAGETTTFVLDAMGNIVNINLPNGNVVTYQYDALNRLVSVDDMIGTISLFAYDNNDNIVSHTDGAGNVTTTSYDALNRRVSVVDPMLQVENYTFDDNGNLLSSQDANGNVTSYTYNVVNLKISELDAMGGLSNFAYDAVGNLLSVTDANSNSTVYTYDAVNRQVTETLAGGGSLTYAYDPVGNLVSRMDYSGAVTDYHYDAANRLTMRDYPGPNDDNFTYTPGGQISSAWNALASLSFSYDAANRLLTETLNGKVTETQYNVAAGIYTLIYPSGKSIEKELDLRGRLAQVRDGGTPTANYVYDAADRVLAREYPGNGITGDYTLNPSGRISNLNYQPGFNVQFNYDYDPAGNRITEEKVHRPNHSQLFSYDATDRLLQVQEGVLTGSTISPILSQVDFDFDPLGNRNLVVDNGLVTTYTSNVDNQYTSIVGIGIINPVYDGNGNVVFDGVNSYAYDSENRLESVNGGATAVYAYDPFGRRISSNSTAGSLDFYYSGSRLIEEYQGGTNVLLASYVYGNYVDEILTMDRGGFTFYYIHDAQNNVVALADNAGAPEEFYEYDAFGEVTVYDPSYSPLPATAVGNPYVYTGRRLDPETGLYYYRARYYDPVHGRFLQRDPLGYVDGLNLYAYVENNPVNRVDPSGLDWWEWIPIVSTIGHALADPEGRDCKDYASCKVDPRKCRVRALAAAEEERCRKCIRVKLAEYVSDWFGVEGVLRDAVQGLAGVVAAAVAKYGIKTGAKGAIGGAVTGGALAVDAAADLAILISKADDMADAAEKAEGKYCKCPRRKRFR